MAVPTIPGIEGLGPGAGRVSRTDAGNESFLSAPVCSEARDDLCLSSAPEPEPSPVAALLGVEQGPQLEATAAPEAVEETGRLRDTEPEPTPEPWGQMEVRPGDTLIALANWFGLSPFDIAVANGAAVDDYLITGTTLVIPVPESEFTMPPEPDIPDPTPVVTPAPPPPPTPQPTPAPVVADPPDSPPPSGPWTEEEIIEAICSLPWPCEQMVRIATCESGLNPSAVNPIGYYGLFQINYMFEGWDNPWTNAEVAYYEKYLPMLEWSGDGLAPWPVCRYY